MSKERKEYPFEKTFDVEFDESALKTFNDLIKEKGIRHFKLESDLYGILDVVSYEEYEKLQQKVEQLEKDNKRLKEWKEDLLSENIELENIRKEAIEYIEKEIKDMPLNGCKQRLIALLNILNKGSEE